MEVRDISLNLFDPSPKARAINLLKVDELAISMRAVGLINPISARDRGDGRFEVVAGHHRHKAAGVLGWQTIPCVVVTMTDLQAELAEIDENLVRSNPTPAEEAHAVARRKVIYEALHPETKHGTAGAIAANLAMGNAVAKSATASAERFTKATADAIGKSERKIQAAAARGEALGSDLLDIAGTSLDKGVELDALVSMPESDRKEIIAEAKAGKKVSARSVAPPKKPRQNKKPTGKKEFNRLVSAWKDARSDTRDRFLAHIGAAYLPEQNAAE